MQCFEVLGVVLLTGCLTVSGASLEEDGPRTLLPGEERKARCPSSDRLGKLCTCWTTTFGGLYIECTGLEKRTQLNSAFSTLSGLPLFGLGLLNSSLSHLPGGVLAGGLQALYLRNSRLSGIRGPGPSPFEGVSDSLVHFDVEGERSAWSWRWMDLAPLTRIKTLRLKDSDVRSLDRGVSLGLSPVRHLSFVNCQITHLTDLVFSSLSRLTSLDLSHNEISRLVRTMLPSEASQLLSINLRHNKLSKVEEVTFQGIKNLQVVDLAYNLFTTLDSAQFRPLLNSVKKHVYLADNPLSCDCRLRWLVKSESPHLSRIAAGATCLKPMELEGRALEGLRINELEACRKTDYYS